jgi:hypothetical protein
MANYPRRVLAVGFATARLTSTNATKIPKAKNIPNIPTIHNSMSDISVVGIPEGDCIQENCIPAHSNPIDGPLVADVHQEVHLAVQMVGHLASQHKQMLSLEKA